MAATLSTSAIVLYITDKERQYARSLDFLGTVPAATVRSFTFLQTLVLVAFFTITRIPFVDGFFPRRVLIAVLVPVRIYLLPTLFGAAHVDAMDADGEPPNAGDQLKAGIGEVASPPPQVAEAVLAHPV